MKNYGTGISYPEAFITKGKQRVKQFGGTVYLKDGDNFEVEIFNPTGGHILAKISLDGKLISHSGLIIRPGERIFLERYLDSNNKFLYSTYEVNGNNPVVQNAIKSNGNIKVEFYSEMPTTYCNSGITTITSPIWTTYHTGSPFTVYPSNTVLSSDICSGTVTATATASPLNDNTAFTTSTFATLDSFFMDSNVEKTTMSVSTQDLNRKIETGTVEKGESSKQKFEYSNRNFYSFPFHTSEWKILPSSQKPITSNDLKQFCTNCGKKIEKSTFKFCPNCGEKLE